MRKNIARRGARFSLSAHLPRSCANTAGRMGGEGRGEVGSSSNADEFNAKAQRRNHRSADRRVRVLLSRRSGRADKAVRAPLAPMYHHPIAEDSTSLLARFASLPPCAFALNRLPLRFAFVCFVCFVVQNCRASDFAILKPAAFAHHVEHFNSMEDENVTNFISNAQSWAWLQKEIPFFECPDQEVEELYYFRWWSFRKHLVKTPAGFVITEFLTPVKHAGIYNTISCAAGFHIAEGRWLRDQNYLGDYISFWLRGNEGKPPPLAHRFSSWLAAAAYERYLVNYNRKFLVGLLNDLVADYKTWEQERQTANGLFWQFDVRDGMEESLSGSRTSKNLRPTINSYMFANAQAIAAIARLAGNKPIAKEFDAKAAQLKQLVQENLWNDDAKFFEVRASGSTNADGTPSTVSARTEPKFQLAGTVPGEIGRASCRERVCNGV